MNSMQWATWTEFVKYLGRTRKCKVEETPKGWFITYIDRDSETIFKENMKNKRIKVYLAEEEKQERDIRKQIELAEQLKPMANGFELQQLESQPKLMKLENGQKVSLSLGSSSKTVKKEKLESSRLEFEDVEEDKNSRKCKDNGKLGKSGSGGGRSTLDELMREQEKAKEDYWLFEGTIVKVVSKALAEKGYYKQKGIVRKVIDKYIGEIEMLESRHVLRVDQEELKTVIPQIRGLVRIVNGAYRGSTARLVAVDANNLCEKVQIEKGIYNGRVLQDIEYEDICKIVQ